MVTMTIAVASCLAPLKGVTWKSGLKATNNKNECEQPNNPPGALLLACVVNGSLQALRVPRCPPRGGSFKQGDE